MRFHPWIWAALAAGAAALTWVVSGIGPLEDQPGYGGHYYESLVDGFRQGHTYLAVAPAPELARLADPYDPAQNYAYRLPDASYYQGRYYLYFGPTPAVLLMLPWRVLTGHHLPERLACVVFAVAALAGLGLLLLGLRDRHFPGASDRVIGLILLVALHATWLPVMLRRPGFWELPYPAALACLWWALYFLWRLRLGPPRLGRGLAVGAALALLLGSRPTYLFAAGAIALLAAAPPSFLARPLVWPRGWWRGGLGVALALGSGGIALLAYNLARFGRAGEFGQSYQLPNVNELHLPHYQLSFFPYNAWLYLTSIPELSPYFPFFKTVWLTGQPAGYQRAEEMHGACLALPVHFLGWFALLWAWRRRGEAAVLPLGAVLAGATLASVGAAAVLFGWFWASLRYSTELVGGWTVVTAIGLLALFAPAAVPAAAGRRALRILAVVLAAWTVAYVWLASFEHGGLFRATNPRAYAALARPLDYPSTWLADREHVAFGPLDLTVRLAPFTGRAEAVLLSSGRPGMMNRLVLERSDPTHGRLALLQNQAVVTVLPLALAGPELRVRVTAPWLYPPAESPYWDRVADPAERREEQTRFALAAGARSVVAHTGYSLDPTAFAPFVLGPESGATAWVAAQRPAAP